MLPILIKVGKILFSKYLTLRVQVKSYINSLSTDILINVFVFYIIKDPNTILDDPNADPDWVQDPLQQVLYT